MSSTTQFPETSTDGLRRSRRIQEQGRTSNHIVNMALMLDIIGLVSAPTLVLGTRPSMWKITQQSVVKKNLRIGETKQNTHRERERERHKE